MMTPQRAEPRRTIQGFRYIPIAGTDAWRDGWVVDNDHPFPQFMKTQGFTPIRADDGRPFRWSTRLTGLKLWNEERDWIAGADALYYFIKGIPFFDRIVFAHSHGGQVAAICAASRVPIRCLVTIGTPVRTDIPWSQAEQYIGTHIHVYDDRWDWMGWLGSIGDGHISDRRDFPHPDVRNVALKGISHSKIVRDSNAFHWWVDGNILELVRESPDAFGSPDDLGVA